MDRAQCTNDARFRLAVIRGDDRKSRADAIFGADRGWHATSLALNHDAERRAGIGISIDGRVLEPLMHAIRAD